MIKLLRQGYKEPTPICLHTANCICDRQCIVFYAYFLHDNGYGNTEVTNATLWHLRFQMLQEWFNVMKHLYKFNEKKFTNNQSVL